MANACLRACEEIRHWLASSRRFRHARLKSGCSGLQLYPKRGNTENKGQPPDHWLPVSALDARPGMPDVEASRLRLQGPLPCLDPHLASPGI
jgi:hypothetical protein